MNRLFFWLMLAVVGLAGKPWAGAAEATTIDIDRRADGWLKQIPVAVSGFSPEVVRVIQFDLIWMGFTNVPASQADYLITGRAGSNLEGSLVQRINQQVVMSKSYGGASARKQAHAFADDIAVRLTRQPGIAQTQVAFRVETGSSSEIFVADYDGFGARGVTRDSTLNVAPNWDRTTGLYYASYKFGRPYILSHRLADGGRNVVAKLPGSNISPAVSPDGRLVAWISSKSGSPDLWVANADGSNAKRLTATRAEESSPCWSPDSRTICYVSRESGANRMYTISAGGGSPKLLRMTGVPNPTEPDWSPDGKWIVFTSLMRDFNICYVSAKGGAATVLTTGEDPSWAPNSRAVIFCKGPDHQKRLSLLDVPTKQVKDIARILESNSQPSWAK